MIGTLWKRKSSVKTPIGIVTKHNNYFVTMVYSDGSNETLNHRQLRNYFTPIHPTTPLPHPKE